MSKPEPDRESDERQHIPDTVMPSQRPEHADHVPECPDCGTAFHRVLVKEGDHLVAETRCYGCTPPTTMAVPTNHVASIELYDDPQRIETTAVCEGCDRPLLAEHVGVPEGSDVREQAAYCAACDPGDESLTLHRRRSVEMVTLIRCKACDEALTVPIDPGTPNGLDLMPIRVHGAESHPYQVWSYERIPVGLDAPIETGPGDADE